MTASKSAAAATEPGVAVAAQSMLARGNAVDAVCAGVMMAVALEPGVLFGPLHVIVAGPGFGLRCVDGRLRQPGRGAPRPRGFLSNDEVPSAARVAVPALPAAIATALSMFGKLGVRRVVDPALATLTRDHPRRALLAALAREGPAVLAKDPWADAITAAAGRFSQGQLTRDDLRAVRAPAIACELVDHAALAPVFVKQDSEATTCHAVCAADHRGGIAAACYEVARDGVSIDALGVIAPHRARPVMRGVRRTDPGEPLPCATSIALVDSSLSKDTERFDAAIGFSGRGAYTRLFEAIAAIESGDVLDEVLRDHAPSACAARGERTARAYSFTP